MADSISGTTQSSTDAIVAAYKKTQQASLDTLAQKKTTLEKRQVFFNSLRTYVDSLAGSITPFTDSTQSLSKFQSRKVVSSDVSVATVSASSTATAGINTLKVDRLASGDILASDRKTLSNASGYTAGTKSFDLIVDGKTTTVSVDFDGTEDNAAALTKISDAINNTADVNVTAGFLKDTTTTGRLTLSSKTTGTDNRITFADPDNVLSQIGLTSALTADPTNRTVFTSTTVGYLKSDSSQLDSQFKINGIDVTRGTNTVSDVLAGLTITLLKAQDASADPLTLTTSVDEQGVNSNIVPLLDNLNKVFEQLNAGSQDYKDDYAIRSFRSNLRQVSSTRFEAGSLKYLSDVGITADDNGKLSVTDTAKLKSAISSNPADVAKLFEEFSKKLDSTLGGLLGDDGLIQARTSSISSQIKGISSRSDALQKRIDGQGEALRKQYEVIMGLYIKAQQQFTMIGGLSSSS